ncbi:DUF1338 domain protein [Aspergillus steynii IBT 23096]|uniref:2-oxoadipate dioxygenase/decarboxylase n=1 Tax=Aspergillus steynii IBT 23096 TaxID=1392250 RepID=A0A2I2G7F4_9EURO|nr:DUF1338 domain protein [Aspergillus steynii IBT 23096]PLB48788.1 DUF1338 domain protein [Aspergillus steynii IBT 23096]
MRISSDRLTLERHGAIRLGTPFELRTIKRIFAILGMHPVGYYDLSIAGLPMHATCFRPTDVTSLERNPFRVFTTLLRPELLASHEARELSLSLLGQRKIFSHGLFDILDVAESQGGRLNARQAETFIPEALATFGWQSIAAATLDQYEILKAEHPILADIVCFQNAHINHLTPRTLDITAVQSAMKAAGMAAKSQIEGPPPRKCPILLRQTSFLALEEPVQLWQSKLPGTGSDLNGDLQMFDPKATLIQGSHKARFGEIEQRGAAVTPKGRDLYDKLLQQSRNVSVGLSPEEADARTIEVFQKYPDSWKDLRQQGLIYCQFRCIKPIHTTPAIDKEEGLILDQLISRGVVEAVPITYEDFLPLSAAGIFQSNLQTNTHSPGASVGPMYSLSDQKGLGQALEGTVLNLDDWYADVQRQSLERVAKALGFALEDLMDA